MKEWKRIIFHLFTTAIDKVPFFEHDLFILPKGLYKYQENLRRKVTSFSLKFSWDKYRPYTISILQLLYCSSSI